MAHRILSSNLETSLLNNDPFAYAHLIKFERPTETETGRPAEKATDYSYIGDGSFDITWDDGSSDIDGNLNGPQIYVANRVLNVGTVSETIQAKASNINIELSTIAISTTFTGTINVTSNSITANESLVDVGFAEGDVLKCTTAGSNNGLTIRIDEFSNDNKTAAVTPINRTSISTDSAATYTLDYASDETIGILSQTNKFVNREVFIYKAHIDPATGSIIGDPYLLFKGIIASAKLSEDPSKSSKISWGVTSHWGDFVRVNGRSTSDAEHRALDGAGSSDLAALVRPEYASDLGFLHSEQSLNVMAVYQVKETRYKEKRRGGIAGLMGGKKTVEYEVEVDRELDLRFNLDAKRLPVVYGVQRIDSFPIFIDSLKDNSNVVHVAYALCEGEIAGIYDIYVEDQSSICIDQNDNDTRSNSSTAKVLCTGRMDRGDTLSPRATYNAGLFSYYSGGSFSWGTGSIAWNNREGLDGLGTNNLFNYQPLDNILGGVDVGTLGGSGITHEKGTSFTTPIPTDLVVHTGKPFQRSSNTLSKIASENNFKVQNDYFESTGDYWGPNHQLLDTAYVTAKFTIGEGETTIPELEFIVRGKMIDCYNYDNSYLQDYTFSDPLTGFAQGDIVTIKNTSGDTILSTATIADIESYKDENGSDIYRVRFQDELTLGSATAFYMTNGVNNYHFTTHDHIYATGTVASTLTGSTTWSDNATLDGVNAEVVVSAAMYAALIDAHFIGEVTDEELSAAYGSFLSGTSINTFEINASGNVIEDLGNVAGASSISEDVQVIVKDAIHLATSESSTDDAYVNLEIELVRTFDDQSQHIQKRKITDYTGLQRVAIVDRPWDSGVIPQAGDTYRLISTGDKRVSTNPAMQLLDYITSTRYGRGLDVYKDINIETFKEAARDCDTRSSVTMLVPATANVVADAVYKYEDANPVLRFQGTVESVTPVTISGTNYKEIEFKDVIGKIATKWSDWRYFLDGELVWYAGGVYTKSGDGFLSTAPTGASVAVTISKVSGSGDATLSLDVDSTRKTFDGNPVVKKWKSSNNIFQSGYSLYDSDDVKYWRYLGWNDSNQRYVTRHQTNAVINTNNSVFQNINSMLAHFNGIFRYSNGKYDLVIKKATDTFEAAQYITDEDIIGSINVEDAGQKGTYNSVSVGIPDPQNRYETRTVSFFDSTFLKKDRNVPKKGDIKTPYVTNYFNARINARQYLEESRKSLKIAFKMEPKGLLLTSGSLIKVTNNRFGWVEEEFRITNLNFQGNCLVDVTAEQHSEEAYLIKNLTKAAYTPGEVAGQAEPVLSPPTSLQILNNNEKGGTRLGWTNSSSYKAANHTAEIYRGTVDDVNDAGTQLVATAKGSEFTDPVLTAGTYYYWIRYSIVIDGTRTFLTAYEGSVTATIADIVDGQSAKTVNIYRKNDNTINTSTGTFADPLAGNTSWSLSVPALTVNNDIVYVSTRTFTSDGLAPQDAAWSTPAIYSTRVDGADADALVITDVDTSVPGETTLTFSDSTAFTIDDGDDGADGDTKGVVPIYASDAAGNDQDYTQGSLLYVNYYEYTNTKPTLPVSSLTFVKYVGEDGDSEGVIPIYADDVSGTNATFTYSSQEFINFYEWTGTAPVSVPTGLSYVKFVGDDGADADALVITDVDTSVPGETTLTFSDSTAFTIDDGDDGADGDTKGVVPIYASDAAGNDQDYTQGSLLYVNYYEYTNTKPTLPVSSLTFVKYVGEDGDSEGVIPIYADDVSGTNATFTYSSQEFINFYEWTGTAPVSVPTGLSYVKFVGDDGDPGDPGDDGLRTVQGYLYYEKTTAGAPSAPSGNTYTFATGDVSGGTGETEVLALSATSAVDKWTNEPRTQDPTTNTHYTIRYSGTESSAGSSTITVTYSDVLQYTNFTGVVTFENGDFLDGGSTITTIDGGNIDAASQITVGTGVNKAGLSGAGTAGTDIRIFAGDTIANRATAPFRVDQDGVVYATNAEITGEVVASTLVMSTADEFVNLKAQSVQDDSITLASLNAEVLNYIDSTAATLSGNTPGDYQTDSTTFTNATLANTPLITLSNFDHGLSNPRITVSQGTGFFSPNDYSVAQRTIPLTVYRKPSSGSTWTSLFSTNTTLIQQLFPQNPDFTKFYYAGSFSQDFEDTTLADNTEYDYKIELTAVVIAQEASAFLSLTANENAYTSNGAGDAATLNGLDSTQFLRSDENDAFSGILNVQGSLLVNSLIRFDTDYTVISSGTAQTEIGSFNYLNNAGAKLIITAEYGSERQITELLVTHNNTTAIAVEYGSIDTDGVLATYDVDISGNNVRILATRTSTNTTIFTTSKQIII